MYKKFIFGFAGSVFILMIGIGIVNLIVDPYNIWRLYQRVGFNQWSPKAEDLDRLIQPIVFRRVQPKALFLGTSQVIWGIEPSEYTRLTGDSAYNLAMLGASVYEIRRMLEHAIALDDNLHEVFVCVNFELFAANAEHPIAEKKTAFDEEQIGKWFITWDNIAKTLFSWQALKDSIDTVRDNKIHHYECTYYMPTGRWHDDSIERYCQNRKWQFNASMAIMARANYYFENMQIDERCMGEMKRIVDLCNEHGLKLTVYTMPSHARSMQLYADAWPVYEEWMRRMVEIVPVMNFSGYNDMTMSEAELGLLTKDSNPYFWDSHHANSYVGNLVLAVLAGEQIVSPIMGTLVTQDNVEAWLAAFEAGRIHWEKQHPESVEEIRYYKGFSRIEPMALQGRTPMRGQSVVRLDPESGVERLSISLPHSAALDLTGERLTPINASKTMYALLEREDGTCYYAMAEPILSPAIASFMHNKKYEMNGFRILEPLREVEVGRYNLCLIEVVENGLVYQSDSLAVIEIK